MEKVKNKITFITLLCLLSLVLSCSEGDFTIFYQVTNEKAIKDTDLENTLTVQGMVNVNSRYYIAAGKLFTRSVTSDNWDAVSSHTNNGEKMCNSLLEFGGYLYAGFYAVDGKHFGLYRVATADLIPPNEKDIIWSEITVDGFSDNTQVEVLKVTTGIPSYLFVGIKNNNSYSLAYTSDGLNYTLVTFNGSDTISSSVRDMDYDGATTYWISTGEHIYQSAGLADATITIGPTVKGSERYEGIICTDDGRVYIGTSRGHIWLFDGAAWTSRKFEYTSSSGIFDKVWFTKFLAVPDTGSSPVDMIVVGTRGAGFYEIDEDQGLDDIHRFSNTSKQELYAGAVEHFFNTPPPPISNTLFVLTAGTGLWRSNLSNGKWGSWTWE